MVTVLFAILLKIDIFIGANTTLGLSAVETRILKPWISGNSRLLEPTVGRVLAVYMTEGSDVFSWD